MNKLTSKDIVKRARQLADLENSSFIGWKENVYMLNEAFQKVYQKAINNGDKYKLISLELTEPEISGNKKIYALPDDFYQLYSLNDTVSNACILRLSVNEPLTNVRYEIRNNSLILYGSSPASVTMGYYPVPQELNLKADDVEIPEITNLTGKTVLCADGCGSKIAWLTYDNSVATLHLYDYKTNSYSSADVTSSLGAIQNACYMTFTTSGIYINFAGTSTYYCFDTSLAVKTVSFTNSGIFKITETKDLVLAYISSETFYIDIVHSNGAVENYFSVPSQGTETDIFYFLQTYVAPTDRPFFLDVENNLIYAVGNYNEVYGLYTIDFLTNKMNLVNEISLLDSQKIIRLYNGVIQAVRYNSIPTNIINGNLLYDWNMNRVASDVFALFKADKDTGYGYISTDNKIKGCYGNTEIDYPNNFFIQMLSYMLAIQYKSKQNASIEGLSALYSAAEEQFYDSISNDDFGFVRIQNAY